MSSWQWDEVEYGCQPGDPLERHNAHQAAKGRSPIPDPDVVRKAVRESAPDAEKLAAFKAGTGMFDVSAPASQDAPLSSRLRTEAAEWDAGEDIAPLLVEAAEAIELLAAHVATLEWERRAGCAGGRR